MATFYLDFEGGNDTLDGLSFANRWKTMTSGATAARIAAGDTIRIMGSPAPTSLGVNGTWTSSTLQGTKTISGATNASPIVITCTGHGYSTGDTVVIASILGNLEANGTWEITVIDTNTFSLNGSTGSGAWTSGGSARLRTNTRVALASPVTQNIASTGGGRSAWTAATVDVTTSLSTTSFKEHRYSDSLIIAAAFTTGKVGHYTLPSTLNLSGYQQVSLWLYFGTSVPSAGTLELRLCSDATGDVTVNTISLPSTAATTSWMPVTVDTGAALGASISSISLWCNSDISTTLTCTVQLNNIIACKAPSAPDSLSLTSLIGKNTAGETFWAIQSINGTRVMLDYISSTFPNNSSNRGYYGTSETVTTYKRETIKLGPAATSTATLQSVNDSGVSGSPITFSGGWDRTAMTTQNLETWLDGLIGNGYAIVNATQAWINLEKLACVRFNYGYQHNTSTTTARIGGNAQFVALNHNSVGIYVNSVVRGSWTVDYAVANSSTICTQGSPCSNGQLTVTRAYANNGGINLSPSSTFVVKDSTFLANGGPAITVNNGGGNIFRNITTGANVTSSFNLAETGSDLFAYDCLLQDTTEVTFTSTHADGALRSTNHDQVSGNSLTILNGGTISSAVDQRHTASGVSWKMSPTSTTRYLSATPLILPLAKIACAANSLVTVKAWMYRDNIGLTMQLTCKGGQIAGVSADVTTAMTAAAATWEEVTISFTPTATGVVQITAEAYGGTTFNGWVDDMTITQA